MIIYKLKFTDGSIYIGKTMYGIDRRYKEHCTELIYGTHNVKMVTKYKELGTLPSIELLEECSLKDVNSRETYWIKYYNSCTEGLNATFGGDGPGHGEDNPNSNNTSEDYAAVLFFIAYTDYSLREISNELDISYRIVCHISAGESHQYLKEEYPKEYYILLSKIKNKKIPERVYMYPNLKDHSGNIYTITNIKQFAALHNLDHSALSKVVRGELIQVKGFVLETTHIPKVISPEGKVLVVPINGISKFCIEHNLNNNYLSKLLKGEITEHKKWKLYE